jgi:hypothetical protein
MDCNLVGPAPPPVIFTRDADVSVRADFNDGLDNPSSVAGAPGRQNPSIQMERPKPIMSKDAHATLTVIYGENQGRMVHRPGRLSPRATECHNPGTAER